MKQSFRWNWCRHIVMAALGISLNAPAGRGQESNPADLAISASLTLDALVAEALQRNPEVSFYEAELLAAKAGRKDVGRWAHPELSGSIGQKRVTGGGATDDGVAWSVSLLQPFEWPGRMGLRKAIANRDVELAEIGLERFRVALAGRIRALGYRLLASQEQAAAAHEVADRFRALREVLVQRDPAGLTPLLETRVSEATELTMQRKASDATLATEAALLELNQLRGAPSEQRIAIISSALEFRELEDPHSLLPLARTNNFELRVRTVELTQQGFRVDLVKNERYPAISLGPMYSEERAGADERIIGLGVSVPLPLWKRNSGNIEATQARQRQAEVAFRVAQREVERKVTEAALIYTTKLAEMKRWRPDSIQHFREAATLADRHYRLGAVPITTYVELQKQYLEAVESLLGTRKEALEAAAQLELLTGVPVPLVTTTATKEAR